MFLLVTSLMANTFLLPGYYKYRQMIAIEEAYYSMYSAVIEDPSAVYDVAQSVENKNTVRVFVIADTNTLSDADEPFLVYGSGQGFKFKMNVPVVQSYEKSPVIEDKTEMVPGAVIDGQTQMVPGTEYLRAMGAIHGDGNVDYYITIETTIEAISASVAISNTFQLYTGLFIIIISGVLILIFANRFLKPVLAVNQATKQMAKLDFSKRIMVTSKDEVGELAQNINVLSDELEGAITRLQTANTQLHQELVHREQIDKMRQEFISNVSHELKTPIALIMGYSEGLKVNVNEDDRDFYCDVIGDEAQKMNKMVRRLLYVAQLDSGAMQPEKTEFFINNVVDRCLNKHSILMKEKGVEAEVEASQDYLVEADIEQIEQVVSNYLTNALHHIDEHKKLRIRITEQEGRTRVSVYNSGNAVPEESLPRLWDSFYKVDKARTREYGGTGLGLYIVRTIMEAHQGAYGVRNVDDGVEFWFELPIVSE